MLVARAYFVEHHHGDDGRACFAILLAFGKFHFPRGFFFEAERTGGCTEVTCQFLGQLPKPDVDYIGGLSPAVSIQQKTAAAVAGGTRGPAIATCRGR